MCVDGHGACSVYSSWLAIGITIELYIANLESELYLAIAKVHVSTF